MKSAALKRLGIQIHPLVQEQKFERQVAEIHMLETSPATIRTRFDTPYQTMFHRVFNGAL